MPRQLARAAASINILTMCAEPKTSAPLTYFQLNAQILHRFSKACFRPAVAPDISSQICHPDVSSKCRGRLVVKFAALSRPLGRSAARCGLPHRVMLFSACRHRASHVRRSISGLIPQFIAEGAARILPLHPLSVTRSSCYFVIVPTSAIADTSNATLKIGSDSVNTVGVNRRVQFASPFPKADYHRNRS